MMGTPTPLRTIGVLIWDEWQRFRSFVWYFSKCTKEPIIKKSPRKNRKKTKRSPYGRKWDKHFCDILKELLFKNVTDIQPFEISQRSMSGLWTLNQSGEKDENKSFEIWVFGSFTPFFKISQTFQIFWKWSKWTKSQISLLPRHTTLSYHFEPS